MRKKGAAHPAGRSLRSRARRANFVNFTPEVSKVGRAIFPPLASLNLSNFRCAGAGGTPAFPCATRDFRAIRRAGRTRRSGATFA